MTKSIKTSESDLWKDLNLKFNSSPLLANIKGSPPRFNEAWALFTEALSHLYESAKQAKLEDDHISQFHGACQNLIDAFKKKGDIKKEIVGFKEVVEPILSLHPALRQTCGIVLWAACIVAAIGLGIGVSVLTAGIGLVPLIAGGALLGSSLGGATYAKFFYNGWGNARLINRVASCAERVELELDALSSGIANKQ